MSSPLVEVYGDYASVETGDGAGYVDVTTDQGVFRVVAEKSPSWRRLKRAAVRHPKVALKAYVHDCPPQRNGVRK